MKKLYLFFLIPLLALGPISCQKREPPSKKVQVLVTIPPYTYFVKRLAEDFVDVTTLVPEGANPHLFEPTPRQIDLVYRSQLWIRSGESFEEKIARTTSRNGNPIPMLNLTSGFIDNIECHEHHHHHHCNAEEADLHLWMSPKIAKQQAILIANRLCELIPDQKDVIEQRAKTLEAELDELATLIQSRLASYKGQSIIVSHPAFGYYCKDFGLKQISIEVEGKEPLPKDITNILSMVSHSAARVVLSQIQHNNSGAIAIAKELKLPCISTDPYSSNYNEMLLHLTDAIASSHD